NDENGKVPNISDLYYIRNIPQTTVCKQHADVVIHESETPERSRRNSVSSTPPSKNLASTPVYSFNINNNQELLPVSPVSIDSGFGVNSSSENILNIGSFLNVDTSTYIHVDPELVEFGSIGCDIVINNAYVDMKMSDKKDKDVEKKVEIRTIGDDSITACLYLDEVTDQYRSPLSASTSQEKSGCYSETDIAAILDRSTGVQEIKASIDFIPNRGNFSVNDSRMTIVSNSSSILICKKPDQKMFIEGEGIIIFGATTGEATEDSVKTDHTVIGNHESARAGNSQVTVPDLSISIPPVDVMDLQFGVYINDDIEQVYRSSENTEFSRTSNKTTVYSNDWINNSNARYLKGSQSVNEENENNTSERKNYIIEQPNWYFYAPDEKNITPVGRDCRDRKWSSSSSSSLSSDEGGYTCNNSRLTTQDQRKLSNNKDQILVNSELILREDNVADFNDNFVTNADISVQPEPDARPKESKDGGLCTGKSVHEQNKAESRKLPFNEVSLENTVKNNEYSAIVDLGKIIAMDEGNNANAARRRSYIDAMLDSYSAETATDKTEGPLEFVGIISKERVHSGTTKSVFMKMIQPDSPEMFKIDNEARNDAYGENVSTLIRESAESAFILQASVSDSSDSENTNDDESVSERQHIEVDVDIIAYF
ncbi:hypothetical protein CHS0354_016008, partial [Potamilus streckersoni]